LIKGSESGCAGPQQIVALRALAGVGESFMTKDIFEVGGALLEGDDFQSAISGRGR